VTVIGRTRARWQIVRRAARDPGLMRDYARLFVSARLFAGAERATAPVADVLSADEARRYVTSVAGQWSEGPALARLLRWRVDGADDDAEAAGNFPADPGLAELLYALVRAVRPKAVIETGVATGFTTAHILAGLSDNGGGQLDSIDLPPAPLVAEGLVGSAIPPDLRERWRYHWGSSRRHLPRILAKTTGSRRIFVHDSDHSYRNMRWELECAVAALRGGDWLVADDVHLHGAFSEAGSTSGARVSYVEQATKPDGLTGIMQLVEQPPSRELSG
jgi:methyltransferase family protein